MKRFLPFFTFLIFVPQVALAQPPTRPPGNFAELVNLIIGLANPIFILIISLILLAFLFGLARTIFSLGGTEGVEQGKQIMIWGAIALFLSIAFWGIVALFQNTFFGS